MTHTSPPRWGTRLLAPALLLLQVACGGGNSDSGSSALQNGESLAKAQAGAAQRSAAPDPVELEAATALTGEDAPRLMPPASATRFLAQTTFGATDAELQSVQKLWRKAWLQQQFAMPQGTSYWDRVVAEQNAWAQQVPGRDITKAPTELTDAAIWQSYITSADQLRKRVGYGLSQILVTSMEGFSAGSGGNGLLAAGYLDVLERNAFGNYRTLLKEVTLNPAMGYYLSMKGNQKADARTGRVPDENYAREIMQLFTIGLVELDDKGRPKPPNSGEPGTMPTYDLDTVTQMARVFTGWDWDYSQKNLREQFRAPMRLKSNLSSPEDVKVFNQTYSMTGHTPEQRLDWALDLLFNHANTGPFISKQLIQRLVTSNPSPDYVGRVAAKFNDNGEGVRGDMKAVIQAILLDREALMAEVNPHTSWGKLREPVLRFTQMARYLGMQSNTSSWALGNLSDPAYGLGQSPMRSPSVFNFYRPGYVPPKTQFAVNGQVAPEFQITTETSVPGYVNFVHNFLATPPSGLTLDYSRDLQLATDANALVQRMNLMLANNGMGSSTTQRIVAAVNALPTNDTEALRKRVQTAVLLTLATPQTITLK